MATFVSTQCKAWLGEIDLSTDLMAIALNYGSELQDSTTFGTLTRTRKGGLKTVQAQVEGYFNTSNSDPKMFSTIGVADNPMTLAPIAGADGERAFAFLVNQGEYSPGGALGEMVKFSASGEASGGDSGLIKGTILLNASAVTATADGTAAQLGAVSAAQKVYAALHVISASGTSPTLDVIVESDDVEGFGGTPETRITFAQAGAATSEWATPVAGAITDDWWRIGYTIGGTDTPTFTFVVFVGIQ